MSDLKNIDEIFKNGAEKQYPVDEILWAEASSQLDAVYPVRKANKGWIYISLALLVSVGIIYGISSLMKKDNSVSESVSQTEIKNTQAANSNKAEIASDDVLDHASSQEIVFAELDESPINKAKTQIQTSEPKQHVKDEESNPELRTQTVATMEPDAKEIKAVQDAPLRDMSSQPMVESQPIRNKEDKGETNKEINTENKNTPTYAPVPDIKASAVTEVELVNKDQDVGAENQSSYVVNPRLSNWFVTLNTGYSHITNNTSANPIVENGLWHTQKGGFSFGVSGGCRLDRFSLSAGLGQATFNSTYEAMIAPEPRLDTISSYYALVTNEFLFNEKVVSLIERRYNTELVLDSNATSESIIGKSKISYVTIPVQIGYTLPLERFEVTALVSSTFMVKPKFTHSAPSNFASIMKQNEQAIRPSLVRPAIHLGLGYRLTTNFSVHAEINAATTNQSMLTTEGERVNTIGFKMGIMTRF